MVFGGLQKLTLLDFPEKTACIVFTAGCNFRCTYCHNMALALGEGDVISEEEILSYLEKRKNMLEGVVVTGGEPLLHKDLKDFLVKVKNIGYLIKLDTNGTNPSYLKELVSEGLLDYVAMDIKNAPSCYELTCKAKVDIKAVEESIRFLQEEKVPYEFRTTVSDMLHTRESIEEMGKWIGKTQKWFIQKYVESDSVLVPGFNRSPSPEILQEYAEILGKYAHITKVR